MLAYLEGLFAGGNESKRVELQFFGSYLSNDQMSVMYRIEGSPKETYHWALRPR